jgi:hypothetical protein
MPRRDDDDDDDYDDRPRRRRKQSSSGSGNMWLILGVVGGVILLAIAGCAGVIIWSVNKAGEGFNQIMASAMAEEAAEQWMEDVKGGKTKLAYDATSSGFKSRQTQQQFEQFVARNPTLTKHSFRTPNFTPNQGGDGKPIVIKYRLHTSDPDDDFLDDEDAPRPKTKPKAKKGPNVPEIDVTITMINEGGVWKVDSLTIP